MPIQISWDETLEHTLYWQFAEKWTWTEFYEAFAKEEVMIANLGHVRHDAINRFTSTYLPVGNSIGTVRHILQKRKARQTFGLTIVCTDSLFLVSMMNILKRLNPEFNKNFIAITDFEEGYELIHQSRAETLYVPEKETDA